MTWLLPRIANFKLFMSFMISKWSLIIVHLSHIIQICKNVLTKTSWSFNLIIILDNNLWCNWPISRLKPQNTLERTFQFTGFIYFVLSNAMSLCFWKYQRKVELWLKTSRLFQCFAANQNEVDQIITHLVSEMLQCIGMVY